MCLQGKPSAPQIGLRPGTGPEMGPGSSGTGPWTSSKPRTKQKHRRTSPGTWNLARSTRQVSGPGSGLVTELWVQDRPRTGPRTSPRTGPGTGSQPVPSAGGWDARPLDI